MNGFTYLMMTLSFPVFIHISIQVIYTSGYSGPDYSEKLKDTIHRYSRAANENMSEIKQKLFARRNVNIWITNLIMQSEQLK